MKHGSKVTNPIHYGRGHKKAAEQVTEVHLTYRGVTIVAEYFKLGWTISWWEGNTPLMSVCWLSSQAAINHAKKNIDAYFAKFPTPQARAKTRSRLDRTSPALTN